jgi:hypothetical protein
MTATGADGAGAVDTRTCAGAGGPELANCAPRTATAATAAPPAATDTADCTGWAPAFPAAQAASAPGIAMAVSATLRRSSGSLRVAQVAQSSRCCPAPSSRCLRVSPAETASSTLRHVGDGSSTWRKASRYSSRSLARVRAIRTRRAPRDSLTSASAGSHRCSRRGCRGAPDPTAGPARLSWRRGPPRRAGRRRAVRVRRHRERAVPPRACWPSSRAS